MRRPGAPAFILAAIFIVLGVLLLLHTLGILSAGIWWPIILILIGLFIIWGVVGRRSGRPVKPGESRRLLGDTQIGKRPWELDDMVVESGLGDVRIDLTTAAISPRKHGLSVYSWVGKIEVIVPADLAISARGSVILGDINILGTRSDGLFRNLALTTPDYDTAQAKLDIEMSLVLGDIVLRRVQMRPPPR